MMLFAGDTTIAAHSIYSRELQTDDFRLGLTSYQVAAHAIAQQQYEQAVEYLQVCFDAFKSDDDQLGIWSKLSGTSGENLLRSCNNKYKKNAPPRRCVWLGYLFLRQQGLKES